MDLIGIYIFIGKVVESALQTVSSNVVLAFILFVVVTYVIYKFLKLAIKGLMIAVASAFFPFVAKFGFGLDIPITLGSIVSFAIAGFVLFLILMKLKQISIFLHLISKPFKGSKDKKMKKEIMKEVDKKLKKMKKTEKKSEKKSKS